MKIVIILLSFNLILSQAATSWQSALLKITEDGSLMYNRDSDNFRLPDFSYAGYRSGGVELPKATVVKTIRPIAGDNTKHIQDAIDYVGSLAVNKDGLRGALLLEAGEYQIYGSLYVKYDGVVLRGVGDGDDPLTSTIIYARGNTPHQRTVITLGNNSTQVNGTKQIAGTISQISDEIVEAGSQSFNVQNAGLYKTGDQIVIYHPATQAWVDAVDKGGVPYPDPAAPGNPDERWTAGQLPILYIRYITSIEGNKISVDAPVFYTLNKSLSQSYIYKPNMTGLIRETGLENLRVRIETAGGTDENHAWQAVRFKSCENAWATHCTFQYFGQSGIITEACYRSTFAHCKAIDPVAIITGERMYNFNTYAYSQLNLFRNCYASNGRHHYISNGTSSTSGNVFLKCVSDAANSVNEGHRQWTQGMLYDNHQEINLKRDFVLGLYNRIAMGTGHGWAAVHSVLWNCDVDASYGKIGLQKPPTAQNYAIGCKAKSITGTPISASSFTRGYVEGQNIPDLHPQSLYEAQLQARMKTTSAKHVTDTSGAVVFPTFTNGGITIRTSEPETLLRVFNIYGSEISNFQINDDEVRVDFNPLSTGIYLVEMSNTSGRQLFRVFRQ